MARMRVFIVLLLAVTAGGVLAYGTYNFMNNQPVRKNNAGPEMMRNT